MLGETVQSKVKIKKEPLFRADDYRPNNPLAKLQSYDKLRLRSRASTRCYNTADLKMPELVNKNGEVEGPTTREIIKAEITARQAPNESDTTDTASEGEEMNVDHVVGLYDPGVHVLGRKKIMYCNGSTTDFRAGFNLSVFTDQTLRTIEVSPISRCSS